MSTARILKATNEGKVQFFENSANGTNKIEVKAPASFTTDRAITLPSAAPGAGLFVQTDASGIWTYAAGTATLQSAYDAATPTITIGGGGAVRLDLAAGGDMLRLTAGATDFELGAAAAGAAYLGTVSAHGLDLKTNNTTVISLLSTGEVGIGVTPESGQKIKVAGTVLLTNASFLKGEKVDGSNKFLIGIDGADDLIIGDDQVMKLNSGGLQAMRLDASQRVAIGSLAAITAKLHVEQSGNVLGVRLYKTGTGAGNAVEVEDDGTGAALVVIKDGVGTAVTIAQNSSGVGLIIASQAGQDLVLSTADDTDIHMFQLLQGAHGEDRRFIQKTVSHSVTASNPNTLASFIPVGANVFGLVARVTTTIGGTATSMDIGVTGTVDRYANDRGLTAGTTTDSYTHSGTSTGAIVYNAGSDLLLTPVGGTFDGTGVIRITLHYEMLTAPTS